MVHQGILDLTRFTTLWTTRVMHVTPGLRRDKQREWSIYGQFIVKASRKANWTLQAFRKSYRQ